MAGGWFLARERNYDQPGPFAGLPQFLNAIWWLLVLVIAVWYGVLWMF